MALYKAEDSNNKAFVFMHCWTILRSQPKWHERMNQLSSQNTSTNKKKKSPTNSSPEDDGAIMGDSTMRENNENGNINTDVPKRPIGS
uniref:No apical meristem-associated C-terminal domain-containing protein n=1 Tax=Oryza brachyantha TaxID=4533 RepID=J3M5D3_ORYBR